MEITEETLYAEIGRQVVRACVLEANLRHTVTENRRLNQRVSILESSQQDVQESGDGLSD